MNRQTAFSPRQRNVRRVIVVTGLALGLSLIFPPSRKVLAQTPGINLNALVTRVTNLEAAVASLLANVPQNPRDQIAYSRYPQIITNGYQNPFVIDPTAHWTLYATRPSGSPANPIPVVYLPSARSVSVGTVLCIREEDSLSSPSGTSVRAQSGDTVDAVLEITQVKAVRLYSDGQSGWWSDSLQTVPPTPPNQEGGSGGE